MITMDQHFFKKASENSQRIALCLALIIAFVLSFAAWGKFFYPAEAVKSLDQWVSGFEVLFLLSILLFRKHWQLWMLSAAVFSGWCGYALYLFDLKLPCACMGKMLNIPTIFSITIDLVFFTSSLSLAYLLGARFKWIYFCILTGFMAALIGYASAERIYHSILFG
jgi:hypothetical protein